MRGLLWAAVAAAAVATASANQCYLEDADATCAICWQTTNDATRQMPCPDTVHTFWSKQLPTTMYTDTAYDVQYDLKLDHPAFAPINQEVTDKAGNVLGEYTVPHANIHSCPTSAGACTPFVANSPGLSTHTAAEKLLLDTYGDTMEFASAVELDPGEYTIIAHYRFFVAADPPTLCDDPTAGCLTKYDVAMGVRRTVLPLEPAIEAEAYVYAAVVGAALLVAFGSIYWAAREGKLDVDLILAALFREEVTLCTDLLFGLGDITAFSVSLFTAVWDDRDLQDIIPICVLFLITGWAASMFNAWLAFTQLTMLSKMHKDEKSYLEHLVEGYSKSAVDKVAGKGRQGRRKTPVARRVSFTLSLQIEADRKQNLMTNLAIARRELERKLGDVITIVAEAAPITALQCVVLIRGSNKVSIAVVITFLLAAVMVGAKLSALSTFSIVRKEHQKWADLLEAEYGELIKSESLKDLADLAEVPEEQQEPAQPVNVIGEGDDEIGTP